MTSAGERVAGLDAGATALDAVRGIDLSGRTAIVTGGYSGIGLETTRALAGAGARVIVPARDEGSAHSRLAGIDGVEIGRLDLADPASIEQYASGFLASRRPVHILVNNAGIISPALARDARGYELHFATNYLGHFHLVERLWPALRAADGARVVNVSAWAHRVAPVDFDDTMFERREYLWLFAYGQSKTANVLHAVDIGARGRDDGIDAFAAHPGSIVLTGLTAGWSTPEMLRAIGGIDDQGSRVVDPESGKKTPEQGAATQTWLATDSALRGQQAFYAENNAKSPVVADGDVQALLGALAVGDTPPGVAPHALDLQSAGRLRELSLRLIYSAALAPCP
jgi:NAD(P)-dependent dehydrogenase (short-subunit alcohol dehydrogenase family)